MNPPSAIHSAMNRERKPFTYTPGGLDLSEIKSERMAKRLMRNAMNQGVPELPPQALQSPPTPSTPIAVPNFNCLPVQVFPTINLPANPKSLLRTRSTPDQPRDPPQPKVPPPSQQVNNYIFKPSGIEHLRETINNNTGANPIVNNNTLNNSRPISVFENNSTSSRPAPMFEYSKTTSDSNTRSLPTTSYGSNACTTPVLPEISYDAEFLTTIPRKVDTHNNSTNVLVSNESYLTAIKETESAATNFTIKPLSETYIPIETKPVEENDATDVNDEQREVKVVKKQVKKEKKVETQNGDQNGDTETEMVVKLPAKKVAPKVETKVDVVKKTLPDGSVEEIKTTTTKTTIDGRTEIKTRTETTITPKQEEEVEEVEEEEEEQEEETGEVVVEETEENGEEEVIEEPTTVVVKKTVNQKPVETSNIVKKEERTETTTTKKVVVVQESAKAEEEAEEEEEEVEEEEEIKDEPKIVVVKKPTQTPSPVQKQESKQEAIQEDEQKNEEVKTGPKKQEVEEEAEEEEEEVEEVEVVEKKEATVVPPKKEEPVKEQDDDEEEEEYEEAKKPAEPTKPTELTKPAQSKVQQEVDEESEYTEEEIESEKEETPKEVPAPKSDSPKAELEKGEPKSEEKKEEPKEESREQPTPTAAPEQKVPLREPSVPLEKVEEVEIKPIGVTHESKTTTSSTEIITEGNDKPAGTLSTQTEYNRYENIVTVNRTTKTLDHSYEQLTQQGIPTVKTYFAPERERVSISPSRPHQSTQVYPPPQPQPQQQQERRHSLLLERLSTERQMPSDLYQNQNYQYNQTFDQQRQWSQEPQSEVVNVSNVKPSSITNQQWYQQSRKDNVIFNNITPSAPAVSSQPWSQPQPQAQPQVQHQLPSQPQPQFQPSYSESLQNNSRISSNTYQQQSYPSYTPTPTNWASNNLTSSTLSTANTQSNQYSLLSRDSTETYQKSTQQYSSSYVPPPWEQDPNYVAPPLETQNFYQPAPSSNTFSPASKSGWKPTPPPGKFSKPISTAYVPPAPNQSFVKPVTATEPPNLPGRKTYYSEYERRYITVPESTYIPSETKYQPQPDPSPQYYYDNNEPTESVEPTWRKELREFTEKTTQQTTSSTVSSVRPPWEEDPKYAKVPTVTYNPTPSWSQTLRPQSYRERSFEAELVGSNEWSKTNTLGRGRPLSSYGNSNIDVSAPERPRGVSVDRYNPNYYQSPPNPSEHGPVQSHTLTPTPPAKSYHNPNVPAYHARASAEPREQQPTIPQPRNWGDSRHSPIQSRSFKYLQWITGTEN